MSLLMEQKGKNEREWESRDATENYSIILFFIFFYYFQQSKIYGSHETNVVVLSHANRLVRNKSKSRKWFAIKTHTRTKIKKSSIFHAHDKRVAIMLHCVIHNLIYSFAVFLSYSSFSSSTCMFFLLLRNTQRSILLLLCILLVCIKSI